MNAFLDDGFDAPDCVVSIEQLYAITMADEEVEKLRTAGEFLDYTLSLINPDKAPPNTTGPCPTAAAFHRLRSRYLESCATGTSIDFRPDTPTSSLLDPGDPRQQWPRLEKQLGMELPPLCFGKLAQLLFLALLFLPATAAFIAGFSLSGPHTAVGLAIGSLLLSLFPVIALFQWAAPHWAQSIPFEATTIGDLAYLEFLAHKKRVPPEEWSASEVWTGVQWCIATSAGVSPRKVRKNTTFSSLNAAG